jgi:hypothetical protein
VDLSSSVSLLINGGFAGVVLAIFLYLIIGGHLVPGSVYKDKDEECKELKAALVAERQRGDAAVAAAAATRDLLIALRGTSAPPPQG